MQKSHAELKNYIQLLRLSRRGVLWLNSEGRIIHANKKVLGELKYDGEEIKDKTIFEINPNMNLRRWKQFWAKLTEKKSLKEDSEYITSDDIIFKVDLQSLLIEAKGLLYCCVIY